MIATILSLLVILQTSTGSVTLAWNANAETDLAGYKVYWGTATRVYGTPVQLPGKPAAPTYTVSGLTRGTTYFFAVTAYNTAGLESGFSNEVSATIPSAPQPPTGLKITSQSASLRWFGVVLLATTNDKASALLRYRQLADGAGTSTVIATPKPTKTQHRAVLYLPSGPATYAYNWEMTSAAGELATGNGTFITR